MKKRNKILILMVISMILGYLPWYNFSAVSSYILKELNLTVSDMGIILSIFQVGYVITVVFTAWLADKVGKKKVIAWATLLTGIFSTLFPWLARDFYSVLILRLLTGLSAGAIYVPGIALLSDWFPKNERGKAVGAYTGALTAAYAGGYFIASPLAGYYGWRIGILSTSIPVFLAAYILFFKVEEKIDINKIKKNISENENQKNLDIDLDKNDIDQTRNDLTQYNTKNKIKPAPEGGFLGPLFATTGYMGHMWELYAFWGWIGPFMVSSAYAVGYSETKAVLLGGQLAAFIILLGAPAVWLLGIAADKWGRTNIIILCASSSLIAELFFGYLFGKSLTLIAIIGFWIGFWVVADSGIYKAALTEMTSIKIRATALGIQSAAGYFMTIISPFVFGKLLHFFNSGITDPTRITNWGFPFLILGIGALLAPFSIFVLRKLPQAKLLTSAEND
ncbi:MAG: MFS transporter [Bacillota bacterium]